MGVMRFCNAAGCREVIPVSKYYCKKHQYLQKEYEERKKHWQRDSYQNMSKEKKRKHNQRVYRQRMAASAKAPHNYNGFYKTSAWVKLSHKTLQNNPICVSCYRKGIIKKADLVDHIEPIRENWDKRLDPNNLQPLCYHCHRIKTKKDHERERTMLKTQQK